MFLKADFNQKVLILRLHFSIILTIIILWQQFGNNHSVGRNNHCNLYKNMSHIRTKLKQYKLIRFRDIKSLSEILHPTAESCRTPLWGGIIGIDLFKIC